MQLYITALSVAILATVALGATPGKLVAPGIVAIKLKDGEPYNITCPPMFEKNLGDFFEPEDYQGIKAACLNADFDTNEGCDKCLTAYVNATFLEDNKFSGTEEERMADERGTFDNVPFNIIPQINFANGCPWAQACKEGYINTFNEDLGDDALGKAFGEMIDKCTGPEPGADYKEAFAILQKIFQSRDAPPPEDSSVAAGPEDSSAAAGPEDPSTQDSNGVPFPMKVSAVAVATAVIAMVL